MVIYATLTVPLQTKTCFHTHTHILTYSHCSPLSRIQHKQRPNQGRHYKKSIGLLKRGLPTLGGNPMEQKRGIYAQTWRVLKQSWQYSNCIERCSVKLFHVSTILSEVFKQKQTQLLSFRNRIIPTEKSTQPAKLVPTFVGRGYSMLSATDPYGRYSLFFRPE
jgi:hypothetical protein